MLEWHKEQKIYFKFFILTFSLFFLIGIVSAGTCPSNIGVCNPSIPFESYSEASVFFNNNSYGSNFTSPFLYNQTYSGSTFNSTYDALNLTYGKFWNNQTSPFSYNHTIITNATMVTAYGKFWYNFTGSSSTTNIFNQNLNTTSNVSFNNINVTGTGTLWGLNITNGSVSDFNPQTNIIQSLGSSAKRWLKGWFQSLDVTGTILTKNMTLNGGAVNWSVYISTDGNLTFSK